MGGLAQFFMNGNILLKIVLFQLVFAVVVLFVMKKLMNRELFLSALEQLYAAAGENNFDTRQVEAIFAARCSADEEAQVRAVAKERFPSAEVVIRIDPSQWGGVVFRIADKVIDCSLLTKINQFFKIPGV